MRSLDQEFAHLLRVESAHDDPRLSAAAGLLGLVRANVEVDDVAADAMVMSLADVAEQFDLTPDDMQAILWRHEPQLGETRHE